jgi:hypothetical protein
MDFTKYVAMLEKRALYFCRSDLLGDPFEGTVTRKTREEMDAFYKDDKLVKAYRGAIRALRESTYVSCWHCAEHESAAMWKLYSKSDEAIAIQSTFARLEDGLPESILVGLVQYVDYDHTVIPANNGFWPFVHKRQSFSHEQEVRAVFQDLALASGSAPRPRGRSVDVQPEDLIEEVYVAPNSADWYSSLVRDVTARYGFGFPVNKSRLDDDPFF